MSFNIKLGSGKSQSYDVSPNGGEAADAYGVLKNAVAVVDNKLDFTKLQALDTESKKDGVQIGVNGVTVTIKEGDQLSKALLDGFKNIDTTATNFNPAGPMQGLFTNLLLRAADEGDNTKEKGILTRDELKSYIKGHRDDTQQTKALIDSLPTSGSVNIDTVTGILSDGVVTNDELSNITDNATKAFIKGIATAFGIPFPTT